MGNSGARQGRSEKGKNEGARRRLTRRRRRGRAGASAAPTRSGPASRAAGSRSVPSPGSSGRRRPPARRPRSSQEGVGDAGPGRRQRARAAVRRPRAGRGPGSRRPSPSPTPPRPGRRARANRTRITYNGIVSCAGTAQSLPPRNRRRCRPGHDPLRREGGGGLPQPWVQPHSRTRSRRFKRFSSFPFVLTWRPSATTATF